MINFKKIKLVSILSLLCFAQKSDASLASVLQTNKISTVYSWIFSGATNPTEFKTNALDEIDNQWLASAFKFPTSINWKNGACVALNNFTTTCGGNACSNCDYSIFDSSGTALKTNVPLTSQCQGNCSNYASIYHIAVWLGGMKTATQFEIPYSNAAFFIANITWPVPTSITTLPPSTTALGNNFAANGLTQAAGVSLPKAGIENDITVVVLTSGHASKAAIYTLTGSSTQVNVTDVENGIYVLVSAWATSHPRPSYSIFDYQGNQLGTGFVTGVGTATGTILGALVCGSGTNTSAVPAVNGAIPLAMLLQYPTPKPYVAAAVAPAAGKDGKHHKHHRSLKKELHHEWKKYEDALVITSTGVLPADSIQLTKVKKAEKHVLKALKKAGGPHKKFENKLDNLWGKYVTAATSGNSASVAAVVVSIKKEEKKLLDALAAVSA